MVCRWQWWRQSGFASNSGDCSAPTRHWPSCFLRLQQQWPKQRQPDAAERPKWSVLWPSFIRANSSNYIYGLRAMRFVLYQVLCSPMLLRASVQVHSLFSPSSNGSPCAPPPLWLNIQRSTRRRRRRPLQPNKVQMTPILLTCLLKTFSLTQSPQYATQPVSQPLCLVLTNGGCFGLW